MVSSIAFCEKFDPAKPESRILEAMIHVLAHLFGRRPRKKADSEEIENVIKRSPSNVILEPLPEDPQRVLINHNAKMLDIY
jgi:ATP-dependent RNA helicase DDX60